MIFVLLYLTFRAALPALVVLLDVPFATVGGVFALYLTHTVLSVSAAVGFITLFGVAVMDGVLLVTYVRQARGTGPRAARTPSCDAVSQRLRPGADDGAAGVAGPLAGGAVARHRLRHAAPVRDRHHRRASSRRRC